MDLCSREIDGGALPASRTREESSTVIIAKDERRALFRASQLEHDVTHSRSNRAEAPSDAILDAVDLRRSSRWAVSSRTGVHQSRGSAVAEPVQSLDFPAFLDQIDQHQELRGIRVL
jgi:hypothetical protein